MTKRFGSYRLGHTYTFHMEGGRSEPSTYLGKNRQGMHRFLLRGGQIWTGHSAPVSGE